MVTQKDILTAINKKLVAQYPKYPVYPQRCPKDFKRPSFLIEYVSTSKNDINRYTVQKTSYFTITGFTELDKYYRLDNDVLSGLQDTVIELFADGYVSVGDRAIKVKGSPGGLEEDKMFIDLQFEYYDDRYNQSQDTTPLMGSVKTNIQEV